ncbi:MAG: exodeoxyribonuclease VII small subunit [Planctomycetota bacterium]|nr:MAG: exodeoxyribonuclease VII small subunit [Planctomycetota bacterium]
MAKIPRKIKFEEALARLDEIVEAMESGEIGIEESIARYEEAMQLAAHCRKVLDDAELRVRKIQADAEGKLKTTSFDPPTETPADDENGE